MKLIVGLGNPGSRYENTRHNVGYKVVDMLAQQMDNGQWSMVKKFKSLIIDYQPSVIFCKPQTFMNSSGFAVAKLASFYKVLASDIWVIHDDLDLRLGEYKIQKGVGPKLHYGIASFEKSLATKDFWRVRVGVDNRPLKISIFNLKFSRNIPGQRYVLQDFSSKESSILYGVIVKIIEEVTALIKKK